MMPLARLGPWLAGAGVVATVATVLALAPPRAQRARLPIGPDTAVAGATGGRLAPAGGAQPEPLPGTWLTVANGDRVQGLLREGATLWSGSTGGVLRWDLSTGIYHQYLAPQDGLPSSDVRALARDRDGGLWAATARGLARHVPRDDRWQLVAAPEDLGNATSALAASASGELWVGFEQRWDHAAAGPEGQAGAFVGGGLARLDTATGRWTAVWRAEAAPAGGWASLPSDNVTALALTSDGLTWVGTRPFYAWRTDGCREPPCDGAWSRQGGGLAALDPASGRWASWSDTNDICVSDTVTGLAPDAAGRAWVATRGDGLQAFRAGLATVACGAGHTMYKRTVGGQPLPGTKVWSVAVGEDGRVYAGVGADRGQGIAVLDHRDTFDAAVDDDLWRAVGLDGVIGPVDPLVSALVVVGGELLAGTLDSRDDRGADGFGIKLRDGAGAWRTLATAAHGLPGNRLAALAVNPIDRAVWFGLSGRGVARWDGREWQTWRAYARDKVGATLAVTSPQRSGELNLAVDLAGYRAAFPAERALARLGWDDPVIYSLYEPVAVAGGLRVRVFPAPEASYPAGAPVYTVARGPAGDQVTSLAVAPDGRLWLGARAGLARRPNPDWGETECDEQPATASPDCRWDGGLSAFDGRAWTSWAPAVGGLPSREVQAVAVDRRGQVWAGTGSAFGEAGRGAAVLDPITGAFTLHSRASGGAGFGFDSVTGVAVDEVTGQVWLASQGKPSCPTAAGKKDDCPAIAGAVSRWDGHTWRAWSRRAEPPSPALADQGAMTALTFDGQRGQLWAGGWEGEQNFHWNDGTGLNASVDGCPRDCAPMAWSGQRWSGEGAVFALAVDGAGRLWSGGHRNGRGAVPPVGGVRLRTGTAWTVHTTAVAPLPSDDITALAASGAVMWVGSWDRGAARWLAPELDQHTFLPLARR